MEDEKWIGQQEFDRYFISCLDCKYWDWGTDQQPCHGCKFVRIKRAHNAIEKYGE